MFRRTLFGFVVLLALSASGSLQASNRRSVTASFGAGLNTAGAANHHIVPRVIRVRKNGVVNFVVGGLHQIVVYNRGVQPEDLIVPPFPTPNPGENLFINDFRNVFYLGLNPAGANAATAAGQNPGAPPVNLFNRSNAGNRVESIGFADPGRYLVICNVNPHFRDGMMAWVKVLRDDEPDEDDSDPDAGHH